MIRSLITSTVLLAHSKRGIINHITKRTNVVPALLVPTNMADRRQNQYTENVGRLAERGLLKIPHTDAEWVRTGWTPPKKRMVQWGHGMLNLSVQDENKNMKIVVASESDWGRTFEKQKTLYTCGVSSFTALWNFKRALVPEQERNSSSILDENEVLHAIFAGQDEAAYPKEKIPVTRLQLRNGFNQHHIVDDDGTNTTTTTARNDNDENRTVADDVDRIILKIDDFPQGGMTMRQFFGLFCDSDRGDSIVTYPPPLPPATACVRHLRHLCGTVSSQIERHGGCVVNYHMAALGQTGGCGHFSVVVAVGRLADNDDDKDNNVVIDFEATDHRASDFDGLYFLLLDTWPRTPCAWVPVGNMLKALGTVDAASGELRGVVQIK